MTSVRFALAGLSLLALILASAAGATRPPVRAAQAGATGMLTAPRALDNRASTVVVQFAGDPVAVKDAKAPARLSRGQWDAERSRIEQEQAPIVGKIRSLGGDVEATYQGAYNGAKVTIAAKDAGALASLTGVVAVRPLKLFYRTAARSVAARAATQLPSGPAGVRGEGMKIAIIDTGIDYTHASFGGPGTPAAYLRASGLAEMDASSTAVCMTAALTPCFGPNAPKVKGGVDLVGDSYQPDASWPAYQPVSQPDANPLDCASGDGHGTHTAGTAAGLGVPGVVGPGAAPKADLYAVKIFGCHGPTDAVIDAIDWAVNNGMDVINLSLGASLGTGDDPDAVAAANAVRMGVIVVAAAGNEGGSPYVTGTPASGDGVLSVAAGNAVETLVRARMTVGGSAFVLSQSNTVGSTVSAPLHVVPGDGCSESDYAKVAGTIVVAQREQSSGCVRIDRAIFAARHNAVGVILVNDADGYPPYEGAIPGVGIPFFGALASDGPALRAGAGARATVTADAPVPNPDYGTLASFSSGGPRSGDGWLKPDVTAPGVDIASAGVGLGTGTLVMSGTSMASPFVAGTAALVKQAHPEWGQVRYWTAAVQNTADPAGVRGYATRSAGAGLVQPLLATQTQVVALGSRSHRPDQQGDNQGHGGDLQLATLNFGFQELDRDYRQSATIELRNFSSTAATFAVADGLSQGSPHGLSLDRSTVTVGPRSKAQVRVSLTVPVATAGGASYPGLTPFADVSGLVTFTPLGGSNNGVALRVPYYMVPQTVSHVATAVRLGRNGTGSATTVNSGRAGAEGTADWYAWGIKDRRDAAAGSADLRAVGVSSFPAEATPYVQFAISTNSRWSNAVENEFDIVVDTTGDGAPDYVVLVADEGLVTSGVVNGSAVVAVYPWEWDGVTPPSIASYAYAPTDSSTILAPVLFDQLGLSGAHPRFTYWVEAYALTTDGFDISDTKASFNALAPSVSTGMYDSVAPGGSASENLTVDAAELARTPALGWMVVSSENPSGADEAQLIELKR